VKALFGWILESLIEWLLGLLAAATERVIKRLCHAIEKAVVAWGKIMTAAFGESKLQGLFCLFPLYAVRYGSKLETQRSQIQSVIWHFVGAAAARNVEAACACCSSNSPTEEEIAGIIESDHDVFSNCRLLTITGQSPRSSGGINTCYVSGAATYSDNQRWPLEAWLMKSGDVWKITGIRIGSTAGLAAKRRSEKKTYIAVGVGVTGGILLVLGFVTSKGSLAFLGFVVIFVLIWVLIRQSSKER
jgi:hypothetical protein